MPLFRILSACLLFGVTACGNAALSHVGDDASEPGFFADNPPDAVSFAPSEIARDDGGRPLGHALLGKALPAFSGTMVSGDTFDTGAIWQWTVIRVWGVWCHDSRRDAPWSADLHGRIEADPTLDFVSIHTPVSASRAKDAFGKYGSVSAYFDDQGFQYPTVIDADASIREALQIAWTPTYLLVSPDGLVRGFRTDLSVAGDSAVEDFLADIVAVRASAPTDWRRIPAYEPNRPLLFTVIDAERAFPDAVIASTTRDIYGDGEQVPVFLVTDPANEQTMFEIEAAWDSGYAFAIHTESSAVSGPGGGRIGQATLGDRAPTLSDCDWGQNELEDQIVCLAGDGEGGFKFRWVYAPVEIGEDRTVDAHLDAQLVAMTQFLTREPLADERGESD